MRNGYIMLEWMIAISLTALLLSGSALLIGHSVRALGQLFGQLYCARESAQITGIVNSYLYNEIITETAGERHRVAFLRFRELPHRWVDQSWRLCLELSDGQLQPLTPFGDGTPVSPKWYAGEDGRPMFTVYEGGFVKYAYHWQYGTHEMTVRSGICSLSECYAVGRPYEYR